MEYADHTSTFHDHATLPLRDSSERTVNAELDAEEQMEMTPAPRRTNAREDGQRPSLDVAESNARTRREQQWGQRHTCLEGGSASVKLCLLLTLISCFDFIPFHEVQAAEVYSVGRQNEHNVDDSSRHADSTLPAQLQSHEWAQEAQTSTHRSAANEETVAAKHETNAANKDDLSNVGQASTGLRLSDGMEYATANDGHVALDRKREDTSQHQHDMFHKPWNLNHRKAAFRLDLRRVAGAVASTVYDGASGKPESIATQHVNLHEETNDLDDRGDDILNDDDIGQNNDHDKTSRESLGGPSTRTDTHLYEEPRIGMVLQVYSNDDRFGNVDGNSVDDDITRETDASALHLPSCDSDMASTGTSLVGVGDHDEVPTQANKIDETAQSRTCRFDDVSNYSQDVRPVRRYRSETIKTSLHSGNGDEEKALVASYELVEPLHTQLGIVPQHANDFAYTPVVVSALGSSEGTPFPEEPSQFHGTQSSGANRPDPSTGETVHDTHQHTPIAAASPISSLPSLSSSSRSSFGSRNNAEGAASKAVTNEGHSQKAYESTCHSSSWWQWWFPFTDSWWKPKTQSRYDTEGTAFAGGSHGEVWRGRRQCFPKVQGNSGNESNGNGNGHSSGSEGSKKSNEQAHDLPHPFYQRHHQQKGKQHKQRTSANSDKLSDSGGPDSRRNTENEAKPCDDTKTLILKRLKVEQGYRLLEAGLREVYFGNYLMDAQPEQFTKYVDHFFREAPRRTFGGRRAAYGLGEDDLELWIVFEDAGPSLRSYLYAPIQSESGFLVFQHSPLWTKLRLSSTTKHHKANSAVHSSHNARNGDDRVEDESDDEYSSQSHQEQQFSDLGKKMMRQVLHQIMSAAAFLHSHGIVHRDIKPSNVMCKSSTKLGGQTLQDLEEFYPNLVCVLGDFSSSWNNFTSETLYTNGPSPAEQTDEYAPPEAFLGSEWVPFHRAKPQSYDSWSIGVLALEMLLGTPNVFSVDQRTTALVTARMQREGATEEEIHRALYLAALSNFCIFTPSTTADTSSQHSDNSNKQTSWPLRRGDPFHNASMSRKSCTMHDFHRALRARDPLGIGFDSSADLLLHLIWQLLAWDPMDRITAEDALLHPFFAEADSAEPLIDLVPGWHNAIESQMLDPRMDFNVDDTIHEFRCPKCGRKFEDWRSCQRHARTRRHAKFCTYDKSTLPTCINTHSMLPAHPTSGYCDLQGRRRTIEDFHAIHLGDDLQFYGIFDGHLGNLASKFVSSTMYDQLRDGLTVLQRMNDDGHVHGGMPSQDNDGDDNSSNNGSSDGSIDDGWKEQIASETKTVFADVHERFLETLTQQNRSASHHDLMNQSGTTATTLLVTSDLVLIASIGDSRAVMASYEHGDRSESTSKGQHSLTAIQLTKDHTAADPEEREQVEARGGFISGKSSGDSGIPRVNGILAITRSIGDRALEQYLSREPQVISMTKEEMRQRCGRGDEGYGLSSTPPPQDFERSHDTSDSDGTNSTTSSSTDSSSTGSRDILSPCFVILASDGLWDVMTNQDAVDMVHEIISTSLQEPPQRKDKNVGEEGASTVISIDWDNTSIFQDAAEALALEAYVRGSSDNIGVCVVAIP